MAKVVKVHPSRSFFVNQEHYDKVISPAYDVLDTSEAHQMADGNPISILHLNKPEIDLDSETDPYVDEVYQQSRQNSLRFIKEGYL